MRERAAASSWLQPAGLESEREREKGEARSLLLSSWNPNFAHSESFAFYINLYLIFSLCGRELSCTPFCTQGLALWLSGQ